MKQLLTILVLAGCLSAQIMQQGIAAASGVVASSGTAATPTASPAAEAFLSGSGPTVTWSCTTPSSYICYTRNGSTPVPNGGGGCTTGTLYSSGYSVTGTETDKAVCDASGYTASSAASYTYTLVTPPSFVQSAQAGPVASPSVAFSSSTGANHLLLCAVYGTGSGLPLNCTSTNNVWTQVQTTTAQWGGQWALFQAIAVGGADTVTATADAGSAYLIIVEYSGSNATTPIQASDQITFTTTNPFTSSNIVTANPGETLVLLGVTTPANVVTAGTGYTLQVTPGSPSVGYLMDSQTLAVNPGTYNNTHTSSAPANGMDGWLLAVTP